MAKATFARHYKKRDVLRALGKMPEYRRGFGERELKTKIKHEIGGTMDTTFSGANVKKYLQSKGFSYDKRQEFFKALEGVITPAAKAEEPKRAMLRGEAMPAEKGFAAGKVPPAPVGQKPPVAGQKPNETPEWMRETGRLGIKFEKERKTPSFGPKFRETKIPPKQFPSEIKKVFQKEEKPQKTTVHEEIVKKEHARLTEHHKIRQENIQKSHELDKKESEEESQIGQLLEEKFGQGTQEIPTIEEKNEEQ